MDVVGWLWNSMDYDKLTTYGIKWLIPCEGMVHFFYTSSFLLRLEYIMLTLYYLNISLFSFNIMINQKWRQLNTINIIQCTYTLLKASIFASRKNTKDKKMKIKKLKKLVFTFLKEIFSVDVHSEMFMSMFDLL